MITREEWLRHAVEMLNSDLFKGGLDLLNNQYQISCCRTGKNKITELVFPYDGADALIDDFFPTTIYVSDECSDMNLMLCNIAFSCIQCFYNIRKTSNRKFKTLAESFYFDVPLNKCNPSEYLIEIVDNILKKMEQQYGQFPGRAVVRHKKESEGDKKKTSIILFCPSCGFETKVTRKVFEKHNKQLPTCFCGTKMAQDLDDEISED